MKVGVPKEVKNHEYRVAITPVGVHELTAHGHQVFVERGAGLGSALCSIVVFLIYLGDQHFDRDVFSTPAWLGLSVAILAYWLLRTWLLALRGQMHDDPVVFALKDRTSYLLGMVVGLSLLLAW